MKMKSFSQAVLAGILATQAFSQASDEEEWTVTLKQRNLETGSVYYSNVDREGNAPSQAPVPEGGSEFTLWAYSRTDEGTTEHFVDSALVGAYLPKGRLWITTPDPYSGGIPRTRIDQGFTLNFEVADLDTSAGAPEAAKKLLLDHDLAVSSGAVPADGIVGDSFDFEQRYLDRNGVGSIRFPGSNIPGSDPFSDSGMEYFNLYALPDGTVAELLLSEAQVQIWPMSSAEFGGLESSSPYKIVPEISVNLVNLYPESETWVQVYRGPESIGTNGIRLSETKAIVNDVKPDNKVLSFKKLNEVMNDNGEWTLEVLTETPFGIERISYRTIVVDRDLELRGSFQVLSD